MNDESKIDETWIEGIKTGDLIRARLNLKMTNKDGLKVLIDENETLLVLEFSINDDRVSLDAMFRGEHYEAMMGRTPFCRAFAHASSFADAVA